MSAARLPDAADQQAKAEALALWETDRARLMLSQPFLALLAMQLELVPVVDARLPTAATDGERIYADAHFLLARRAEERLFIVAHEVWHCAALHFLRRGARAAELWNLAADHEVNNLLREQGLRVPEDAILYDSQRGESAETVYRWLQDNTDQQGPRPDWADSHELPQFGAGTVDPDYRPGGAGQWRDWPARVVAAAQQIERQRGNLPAGVQCLIQDYRAPQLPWPHLLRQFVSRGLHRRRQWMPPNRRYLAQGLYLPGSERTPALDIALAVDTSGSTGADLPDFLAELTGIISAYGDYRLRLLMCDAAVHSDTVHTPQEPLDPGRLSFTGGGGTDFRPVFARLRAEPPRVLIWFTDGCGPAPAEAPPYPVLWALTQNGRRPTPWGDVVELPL